MDGSIWIAIGLLLGIILIVTIAVRIANAKEKKLQNTLKGQLADIGNKEMLSFDKQEVFRNRIIGIDTKNKKLAYVEYADEKYKKYHVDLQQVKSFQLMKMGNKIVETKKSGKKIAEEHINEVRLQVLPVNDEPVSILFYSEIEDGAMEKEYFTAIATDWQRIMTSLQPAN